MKNKHVDPFPFHSVYSIVVMPADGFPKCGEELHTSRDVYQVFSNICEGTYNVHRLSDEKFLAIKCEPLSAEKKTLAMDSLIMREAERLKSRHFLTLKDEGKVDGRFSYLVMDRQGSALELIRNMEEDSLEHYVYFSSGTSLKIAQQTLIAIEQLHRIGFIHGNINQHKFRLSYENAQTIVMRAFDCAEYVDKQTNRIRVPRKEVAFRGWHIFASLDAMDGLEQSRKDDLESWFYMIVEFMRKLPWDSCTEEEVRQMKRKLRGDTAESKKLFDRFLKPCLKEEFTKLFNYIVKLDYYSTPDYKFINNILMETMKKLKIEWSKPLDWETSRCLRGMTPNIRSAAMKKQDILFNALNIQKSKDTREEKEKYKEPIEIPGNGQPDGFQETPKNEQIKLERPQKKAKKTSTETPEKETKRPEKRRAFYITE